MQILGHKLDRYAFNTILSAILRSGNLLVILGNVQGNLKKVIEFYEKYSENPLWQKSFITYQTLLIAYLKLGTSSHGRN
jgi:hypothetical protein